MTRDDIIEAMEADADLALSILDHGWLIARPWRQVSVDYKTRSRRGTVAAAEAWELWKWDGSVMLAEVLVRDDGQALADVDVHWIGKRCQRWRATKHLAMYWAESQLDGVKVTR